jgi:hypothetical protein
VTESSQTRARECLLRRCQVNNMACRINKIVGSVVGSDARCELFGIQNNRSSVQRFGIKPVLILSRKCRLRQTIGVCGPCCIVVCFPRADDAATTNNGGRHIIPTTTWHQIEEGFHSRQSAFIRSTVSRIGAEGTTELLPRSNLSTGRCCAFPCGDNQYRPIVATEQE